MQQLNCCQSPSFLGERDLDSAGGFDLMLGKCASCGAPWMGVFCTATSMSGWEPVSREDLDAINAITDWPELKRFMRSWGDTHL